MKHWHIIFGSGMGVAVIVIVIGLLSVPVALAHRSGCHNLHTCPSDTDSYVCGDLGYPCDGSTKAADVAPGSIVVPLVVEATFKQIFSKTPSEAESAYWKKRWRSDKGSLTKIRQAMRWHKSVGSFGPPSAGVIANNLVSKINALFREVYENRGPTQSENRYWLTRVGDKPNEQAMKDAMAWHRQNNLMH